MEKMTLGKELSIFFKICASNSISIVALIILVALAIIFITTNKKNNKVTKKIYITIYAFITAFVVVAYHKHIGHFLDYMMNNLFIAIYFPNLAIYFAAIIISNIVVLISIFNKKITKLIRNINIIMYTIINFLLVLLIGVITDKRLDIYSVTSIYDNANAHALIELTSLIFVLWMIFLMIYKLIRMYQTRDEDETVTVIEREVEKKVPVKERILPENIVEVSIPNFAKKGSLEIELDEKEIEQRTNIEVEKRINTKIREAHFFDKMLTKDDYIVLLNLLKNSKKNKEVLINTTDEIVNSKVELDSKEEIIDTKKEDNHLERLSEEIEIDELDEDDDFLDDFFEQKETATEETVEETTEEETTIEETITTEEEETIKEMIDEEDDYYIEPRVIKIIDEEDDQSSYFRLQELYESVNL